MANRALSISGPIPVTNVSATNVLATGAGNRKRVTETAKTALTPPTSAQCGGQGSTDRQRQPSPPLPRTGRRSDQVLAHFQRAMRQGARLGVGGERVFVRVTRRIGLA